ncbi:hypothetical protein [Fictibacillus phosphorivorans]|uniref:hypothetical protein n=1 Tax=Fictibacillus phosphorivorans TaxID=1221500 RepID=UPI001293916C|nr:hypothetical protein [Fictibacillus phosphorivorans]MQR93720.1 hypothetical protein [Fictibacillus phosphorivorans]
MLSLEEYISKRKKEDRINEFDIESKPQNMQTCMNYIFEYFNQYIDASKLDEKTVLNEERLEKYKKTLHKYDSEIQDWLVEIYDDYDKQLNRSIERYLKKDDLFYLYNTEQEFRSISYDCYAQLIKKNPYLKEQTEMLFLFIKDYHGIQGESKLDFQKVYISEEINEWFNKTWNKYQVNLIAFASDYVSRFFDNEETWNVKHRIKSKDSWRKYEYDYKQKSNLFNINSLHRRISSKPFIKGKKQFLEILLMYCWIHEIDGDEAYWQEYINKTLSSSM